jgi:hypothetical protein
MPGSDEEYQVQLLIFLEHLQLSELQPLGEEVGAETL